MLNNVQLIALFLSIDSLNFVDSFHLFCSLCYVYILLINFRSSIFIFDY